jgi:hypothetical protein
MLLSVFVQLLLYCGGISLNNVAGVRGMHIVPGSERQDNCVSAWVITLSKPAEFAALACSAANTKPWRMCVGVFLCLRHLASRHRRCGHQSIKLLDDIRSLDSRYSIAGGFK